MNSVEPNPVSPGISDTNATLPFSGQGVIFANNASFALKRARPEPSSRRASHLRIPPKFSATAAISKNGYSISFFTGYRGFCSASRLSGLLGQSGVAPGKQSCCIADAFEHVVQSCLCGDELFLRISQRLQRILHLHP